ncbi:MAG: addiction module protein [Acidobacteria bacterium]|nr:addiction module protein [Acidobacteriota bacterium]
MTTHTAELMDVVDSLPIDMKLELIDHLLESVFPRQEEIEEAWKEEVERRIDEVKSGKVKTIPGEEVFGRLLARYKR